MFKLQEGCHLVNNKPSVMAVLKESDVLGVFREGTLSSCDCHVETVTSFKLRDYLLIVRKGCPWFIYKYSFQEHQILDVLYNKLYSFLCYENMRVKKKIVENLTNNYHHISHFTIPKIFFGLKVS